MKTGQLDNDCIKVLEGMKTPGNTRWRLAFLACMARILCLWFTPVSGAALDSYEL